jgi:hypothetical protein
MAVAVTTQAERLKVNRLKADKLDDLDPELL